MAHKLPSTQLFGDTAFDPTDWQQPCLYWPTLLWNSGTTDPSGYGINPSYSELHNAYQTAFGVVTARRDPQGDGSRRALAHTFRPDFRTDSDVRLEFAFRRVSGGQNFHVDSTWTGVGARIADSAGSQLVDTGTLDEGVEAPTGYWFMLNSRSVGALIILRAQFIKVVGPTSPGGPSTVRRLAEFEISRQPNHTTTNLPADRTRSIRMTCETNGGVTELRGYFFNWQTGVEDLILSHDDGTFPITAAGHNGFIITSELSDPTTLDYRFIHGVSAFEVRNLAGTVVFRDEFKRTNATNSLRVGPDRFLRYGDSVASQFTGDLAGKTSGPNWANQMFRATGLEKLEFNSTNPGGWHLSQDPPENPYVQSATVSFEFGTGTGTRIVGAAVRAAIASLNEFDWQSYTGARTVGYNAVVESIGANFALRVLRNGKTIAYRTLNQSGDPVTIAVTEVHTLTLHAENRDGGSPASGNVHLTPTIGGNKFTDWFFLGPGILEEDDGTLTDTASERVLAGGAIGFWARSTDSDDLFVHSFAEDAIIFDLDEREQAGINLGNERDGVIGVLTVPHEWPITTTYMDYGEAIQYDSQHVHRHAKAKKQRRKWRIHSDAALKSETDALKVFFSGHKGADTPFYWVTPEGEGVVVVLGDDTLRVEKIDIKTYTFRAELHELLGAGTVVVPGTPDPPSPGNHPEARFEMWGESLDILATGGFQEGDDPDGPPRFGSFYFPDDYGTFTAKILLEETVGYTGQGVELREAAPAPRGGSRVHYELQGTAIEGTHYSIAAADQSPIVIPEGETEATFTVTILEISPDWFSEKQLNLVLSPLSDTPLYFKNLELHAHIYPTAPPPAITLDLATQNADITTNLSGATVTINISKVTGSSLHPGVDVNGVPDDNLSVFLETDPSSTLVEGVDWTWVGGAALQYGGISIPNTASGRNVQLNVRQTAALGGTLKFNLWHDQSDLSDSNIFNVTHDMRLEITDNTIETYPGEPTNNVHGPAGAGAVSYLVNRDAVKKTPFNDWIWTFEHTDNDPNKFQGYNRKSGNDHTFCAGPRQSNTGIPGNQEGLKAYTFASMYFTKPTVGDLPHFLQFGMRDRGFQWAPPQNPPGTTPSTCTEENLWTTLVDTGVNFTTMGVAVGWEVRNYSQSPWRVLVDDVVSSTELTLGLRTGGNQLTTESWAVGDSYTVHPAVPYARNFQIVIDTQSDPSGSYLHDGAYWSVYSVSDSWGEFGTLTYDFDLEDIRDHTGTVQTYLRFWFLYHMTDPDRLGDATNRIWYPFWWGSGLGETHESTIGKRLGVFWPMHLTSASPITTSPLPRFNPRRGRFRSPNGNCEVDSAGISSVTITVV